jgi:PAS domain S-box-containing protein
MIEPSATDDATRDEVVSPSGQQQQQQRKDQLRAEIAELQARLAALDHAQPAGSDGRSRAKLPAAVVRAPGPERPPRQRARTVRYLEVQVTASRLLLQAANLDEAAEPVLALIGDALGWDVGAIWLEDRQARRLRCAYTWCGAHVSPANCEAYQRVTAATQLGEGIGLPGRVWSSGLPDWVADLAEDENLPRMPAVVSHGLRSAFAFPIRGGERVVGAIEFFGHAVRAPDEDLLQATAALGNQVGQFLDRCEAEAATRASEDRHRAMVEVALDCVITIDAESRIVEFNPAAERTFGYRREEVLGRSMAELIVPPSLREAHYRGLARYLAGGAPRMIGRRVETRAMHADGTEFPVELAISRLPGEQQPLFTAYLRDITARERAEQEREELLALERRARAEAAARAHELETVFHSMTEGVLVCDARGQLTRVNARGAALFGLSVEEALVALSPVGVADLLHGPDGAPLEPENFPLARALGGETLTGMHFTIAAQAGGSEKHVRVSCAPLRHADGAVVGALAVLSDMTEIFRLERQKDEFLSIASHELKTPLTSLKILTQFLRRRLERAGVQQTDQFARMDTAIGRMERLINDLLDVTRIESGKLALNRKHLDLALLVRQVADDQSAAAERHIAVEAPDEAVMVDADADRIVQVLANLLSNALKYSPARTAVEARVTRQGDMALVAVHDQGPGIPPAALSQLFQRFYRVPGVEVQSGSGVGLGLGLYISREIVERHSGRIWAESLPGAGTTFSFSLPLVAHG